MGLQLPAAFANSYQEFASYPENVVHKSTYIGGLRRYRIRLDEVQSKLFTPKDANINVPFRDLQHSGDAFHRQKIRDDNELKVWLGDESASDPGKLATKRDPKCRFM
ncbi:MAG: hypothetical protein Q9167_005267 [Letrouitia subvulpina]